jgi:hypothetical protein
MPDKVLKRITWTGADLKVEIWEFGFFERLVPRDIAVTEDQARCLAGKGFTVEDPVPANSRKDVTHG